MPRGAESVTYAPEFAVEVAIGKYCDHRPLERQVRVMRREGLDVTSQTHSPRPWRRRCVEVDEDDAGRQLVRALAGLRGVAGGGRRLALGATH